MANEPPQPPPGFSLDGSSVPPPPPGFAIDGGSLEPPPGFALEKPFAGINDLMGQSTAALGRAALSLITDIPALRAAKEAQKRGIEAVGRPIEKAILPPELQGKMLRGPIGLPIPTVEFLKQAVDLVEPSAPLDIAGTIAAPALGKLSKVLRAKSAEQIVEAVAPTIKTVTDTAEQAIPIPDEFLAAKRATPHADELADRAAKHAPAVAAADDVTVGTALEKVQQSRIQIKPDPADVETIFGGKLLKARTELIDSYAPIESIAGKTQELTGRIIPFEKNPYNLVRLYAGASGPINRTYNSLSEILKPTIGLKQELSDLFTAQRDFERAVRGFANPGAVTEQEALLAVEALKRRMDPGDFGAIVDAAKRVRQDIGMPMLDRLQAAGVLSEEGVKAIKAKNQLWAPFDVMDYVVENVEHIPHGVKSFQVSSQDVIKSIKGTEKAIRDPMESLVNRIAKAEYLAQRNEVARTMAALADDTEVAFVLRLKSGQKPPRGYDTIHYFDDGVKRTIAVPTQVADSMKGMSQKEADFVTKFVSLSAQGMRAGATVYNIPFALISNPIRDAQTSMLTSGRGALWLTNYMKGFAAVVGKTKDFQDYLAAGGDMAMLENYARPKTALSDIRSSGSLTGAIAKGGLKQAGRLLSERTPSEHFAKIVTSPFELVRQAGSVLELTPRVALFKQGLENGMGAKEAAFYARNGTVDFSRSGDSLKVVNKIVPFLNANLHGNINVLRYAKEHPAKASGIIASTVMLPVFASYYWNARKHKEIWDDIPEYEKQNYLIHILGWKYDERKQQTVPAYIKIPLGVVGQTIGNPTRHFLEYLDGTNPMAIDEIATQMLSDISPVGFASEGKLNAGVAMSRILPPIVRTSAEIYSDKNFGTGLPITPYSMQKVTDPSLQYVKGYTSETARALNRFSGNRASPVKIDHFLKGNFGPTLPYLAEPDRIMNQITGRLSGSTGGAQAALVYEKKRALEGDPANMRIRFQHAIQELFDAKSKTKTAQPQVIMLEVQRAAKAGIPLETILNALEGEIESQSKGKSIDRTAQALLRLTKNEVQRMAGIQAGVFQAPPGYPKR